MFKIIGVITVIAASAMTGLIMSGEIKERVKFLREIRQNAIYIKSDLEYRAPTIKECWKMRGKLFSDAWGLMEREQLLPSDALKEACENIRFLNNIDKEIIFSYAENLYIEEAGGQIANIKWLIDAIGERIKEADEEFRVKGRMYKSGSILVGVGLVILLL